MKVSIITATFNSAKTIRDTIESVLRQNYDDIEYIIKDGCSKDATLDICKEYIPSFDGRMRIISSPDKGIYDAMNQGFMAATGDILCLINSDDLFAADDAISNVVKTFRDNSNIDAVYADLYYVSANNTNRIVRKWKTGKQKKFAYGWLPAHPTFYMKKSLYDKYGMFDLSFKLAADFELMLRYIEKHHIQLIYLEKNLVKMRLGGATSGSLSNIYKQNIECLKAFKKNGIKVSCLYPMYRFLPKLLQFLR